MLARNVDSPTAQADPDKPVTPPDSYRVVMENDRVRMIEIHIKPRSKVNVNCPPERERFLYMLSDGALILAPPGKTPYEFALHAGETAVFPAVSPTVENDTDSAVRALMVEIKTADAQHSGAGKGKRTRLRSGKSRGKVAAKSREQVCGQKVRRQVEAAPRKSRKSKSSRQEPRAQRAAASRQYAAQPRKANAKPAKKVTGKAPAAAS